MPAKMKAALYHEFGDVDKLTIDHVETPEVSEGEVLVRIKAAGVNPVDHAVLHGHLQDAIPPDFPAIPGWDLAGIVEDRGFAARRFNIGDRVYGYARRPRVKWGTFAEYTVIPESYLAKSPDSIPVEKAGAIPLTGLTAYQSMYEAGSLKQGQTVMILGASGGVGSLAIQLAAVKGARVIGVASQKNHRFMEDLGADETIDYQKTDVGEAVKERHPEGVDLIFDCAAGETLSQSIPALKPDGKLVSILNRGDGIPDDVDFQYVFVEPHAPQLDHLRQLVDAGEMDIPVSETFTLEEAADALQQISTLHTTGKIVVTP